MTAVAISPPDGFALCVFDSLDSSNAECRRMADAGRQDPVWVVADQQTAGRGRQGKSWVSAPGNLYASLLYTVACDVAMMAQLSFVAALAVRDVVVGCGLQDVGCKWPNDILVRGRKISGILLETMGAVPGKPLQVVIGVGLNIAHYPDDTAWPATSLRAESEQNEGQKGDQNENRDQVLARLMARMAHYISLWQIQGFSPIRAAWKAMAVGLGKTITVRLPGAVLSGVFVDLDATGALVLDGDQGRRVITAGDVFFPQEAAYAACH